MARQRVSILRTMETTHQSGMKRRSRSTMHGASTRRLKRRLASRATANAYAGGILRISEQSPRRRPIPLDGDPNEFGGGWPSNGTPSDYAVTRWSLNRSSIQLRERCTSTRRRTLRDKSESCFASTPTPYDSNKSVTASNLN